MGRDKGFCRSDDPGPNRFSVSGRAVGAAAAAGQQHLFVLKSDIVDDGKEVVFFRQTKVSSLSCFHCKVSVSRDTEGPLLMGKERDKMGGRREGGGA